jgi:hypothetical protein
MRDAAIDMAAKAQEPPPSPAREDAFQSQDAKNYAAAALSLCQAWVTVARSDEPRIDCNPQINVLENLITLCGTCHRWVHNHLISTRRGWGLDRA